MGQDDVAKHLESRQSKHSIEIARGEKESRRVEKGRKGKQIFGRASQSRDSVTVAIGVVLIATHLRDRRHKLISHWLILSSLFALKERKLTPV